MKYHNININRTFNTKLIYDFILEMEINFKFGTFIIFLKPFELKKKFKPDHLCMIFLIYEFLGNKKKHIKELKILF